MGMREDAINLFENTFEMILLFEKSGQILYANAAARKSLYEGEEMKGVRMEDVFPDIFRKNETEIEAGSSDVINTTSQKLTAYRKNSTCFPVEARIWWETDMKAYVCMANDILEKEFMQKELEQVKREAAEGAKVKSEFVANVTHELRTPVNGVLGNIKELCDMEKDDKKLHN